MHGYGDIIKIAEVVEKYMGKNYPGVKYQIEKDKLETVTLIEEAVTDLIKGDEDGAC